MLKPQRYHLEHKENFRVMSSSTTPKGTASIQDQNSDDVQMPLLNGGHYSDNYSVLAALLPFFFPALGGLLYGYDIGATSCATISVESATLSGVSWYDLSSVEIGLITSGSLYGALIGSVLAFNIADFLGRRWELISSASVYLVGAIVTALAPNLPVMVVIGLAMHAAPMYIAETAPTQIRGRLISLKEFFIVLGMVAGYGIGSLLVSVVGGWRYMFGASVPLAIIMGIGMWWLPESPRWILLRAIQGKGDMHDLKFNATSCLFRLRGTIIVDSAPALVDEMLDELSYVGEEKEATFLEMFRGKCKKALVIGAGLVLFQQSAGFSEASDATRVSIVLGLFKLVMTGVAVLVVDRLGRRPLLLTGVSGMVISLFLLGSYYLFFDDTPAVAVTALLAYVGCYQDKEENKHEASSGDWIFVITICHKNVSGSIALCDPSSISLTVDRKLSSQFSFGPIGWLMISEIFPLRLRGHGLSIAVLVNFASNALVTFSFSPLEAWLGAGILFYAFGVIAVASLVFIFFIVPETKGLTLEEIETKCI